VLEDRLPGESDTIPAEARAEFAELLGHLQYIGGMNPASNWPAGSCVSRTPVARVNSRR
jgi:hypothetical protein